MRALKISNQTHNTGAIGTYDFIIAGAGLSGLTLAVNLAKSPALQNQKVLLIDRAVKNGNDRTWCFWAKPDEPLPPVVHRIWPKADFHHPAFSRPLDMGAYRYHMIRSADYYRWAHDVIDQSPNFTRLNAQILDIDAAQRTVITDRGVFAAERVFNSAISPFVLTPDAPSMGWISPFSAKGGPTLLHIALLQHFKGWFIRSETACFQPDKITLMDYRTRQEGDTRFVYVLPFSETEALIEFTVFSDALLPDAQYDEALRRYLCEQLRIDSYEILEEEFGVIPMTNAPLPVSDAGGGVIHIGSVGGAVKASSGYAFLRIQRKTARLVQVWEKTGRFDTSTLQSPGRFHFYDGVMLRVLSERLCPGQQVFGALFRRLPAHEVFRFLDEDSHIGQDLRIIGVMPTLPFLRAAVMG